MYFTFLQNIPLCEITLVIYLLTYQFFSNQSMFSSVSRQFLFLVFCLACFLANTIDMWYYFCRLKALTGGECFLLAIISWYSVTWNPVTGSGGHLATASRELVSSLLWWDVGIPALSFVICPYCSRQTVFSCRRLTERRFDDDQR